MNFVPVNEPSIGSLELKYLEECVRSGWISSDGPYVGEFECLLASRCERKYGVAVSSGTAAIDVALRALDIGRGDEVILPTFTIISCVSYILQVGAIPVFVDVNRDDWNMNIDQIRLKITERTKAILAVHIYGLVVDMDRLIDICSEYGINLIEDAAEAIGQHYRNRPCGSFGVVSTFSFYANKHVTTGEGGMILTNSEEVAERCKALRNLCFNPERRFKHYELGWNYRMTSLQAAIGLAQIEKLEETIQKKISMGKIYIELLKHISGIQLPLDANSFCENHYWVFGLVLDAEVYPSATQVCADLRSVGIGTRPFFYPLHLQPVLNTMSASSFDSFPVAEYISTQGFYLPSSIGLTESTIRRVCNALETILEHHRTTKLS